MIAAQPPVRRAFVDECAFALDPFQQRGLDAVDSGDSVLVTAPTGAGKTIIGEYAVYVSHHHGSRSAYTTPIKSLSNQKFHDFRERFGIDQVGLLTGDVAINPDAPIVVMTTEVLRNMMYESPHRLDDITSVVLDEVHYLGDRGRGHIWEEVLFYLPRHVQVTALSATISNADEFATWLQKVRGSAQLIQCDRRPIPLDHFVYSPPHLTAFFTHGTDGADEAVDRKALRRALPDGDGDSGRSGRDRRRGGSRRQEFTARRREILTTLSGRGMLPAICFVFSRVGCDEAVRELTHRLQPLVPREAARRAVDYAVEQLAALTAEEKAAVGYDDLVAGLRCGIAAHHAGLLPAVKHVIEHLFRAGDIAAVFATETLSLGINMPAKTVVIERFIKFDGISKRLLNPLEYTQLTGRAGRRGLDVRGHAVCVAGEKVTPSYLTSLTSSSGYPLLSVFTPGYNTTLNMLHELGHERAHRLLAFSFAQHQRNAQLTDVYAQRDRLRNAVRDARDAVDDPCDCGDALEYAWLRRQINDAEKQSRSERQRGREPHPPRVHPGQVYRENTGSRGAFIVIPVERRRGPLVQVISVQGRRRMVPVSGLKRKFSYLGAVPAKEGRGGKPGRRSDREWISALETWLQEHQPNQDEQPEDREAVQSRITELREQLRSHPTHECPRREEHAASLYDAMKDRSALARLEDEIAQHEVGLAREFDRRSDLLVERGYVEPGTYALRPEGERLRRFHTSLDVIAFEVMTRLESMQLTAPEVAAVAACFGDEEADAPERFSLMAPSDGVRDGVEAVVETVRSVHAAERRHDLETSGYPVVAACLPVFGWASGWSLVEVLSAADISAGDFVKRSARCVDVLQEFLSATTSPTFRSTCQAALELVQRGIVDLDVVDAAEALSQSVDAAGSGHAAGM